MGRTVADRPDDGGREDSNHLRARLKGTRYRHVTRVAQGGCEEAGDRSGGRGRIVQGRADIMEAMACSAAGYGRRLRDGIAFLTDAGPALTRSLRGRPWHYAEVSRSWRSRSTPRFKMGNCRQWSICIRGDFSLLIVVSVGMAINGSRQACECFI